MSQDREPVDTVITINLRFKNSHSKRFKLLSGLATHEVGRKRIREAKNSLKSNVLADP
jgi:hypothetical protein